MLRSLCFLVAAAVWATGTVIAEAHGLLSHDATVPVGTAGIVVFMGIGIWLETRETKKNGK
jgi:hypothetical protein